jgi:hypothetical protein
MFRAASVASTLSAIAVCAKATETLARSRSSARKKIRMGFMNHIEPRSLPVNNRGVAGLAQI